MILFANKIIPLNSRVHSLNYNLHIMSICLENTCIQLYVIVFIFFCYRWTELVPSIPLIFRDYIQNTNENLVKILVTFWNKLYCKISNKITIPRYKRNTLYWFCSAFDIASLAMHYKSLSLDIIQTIIKWRIFITLNKLIGINV